MSDLRSPRRRALLSVSDKKGLVPFAEALVQLGFDLVSTGGTANLLREAGLAVTGVADVTRFPEIMDGRVKTLHPAVHGGLLARKGVDDEVAAEHGITLIDLLVVNLYPFEQIIARPDSTLEEAVENIDVGGPAMLRAAAKNHDRVSVVVDAADYEPVLAAFRAGEPSAELKRTLAAKAFAHTAAYDASICAYLRRARSAPAGFPERLVLGFERTGTLRYGENPHQAAAAYRDPAARGASVVGATQLSGKALSFNNLVDADAALQCVAAFAATACVIVKHANPCGVAVAGDAVAAYAKAFECDPVSAFGGVLAFNRPLDRTTAERVVANQFVEVIVAPSVDQLALDVFAAKPNVRVLACGALSDGPPAWELRSIGGGLLAQERDADAELALETVTTLAPTPEQLEDLRFAWTVVRFVKSNAVVFARGGQTVGIGAGQPSRVWSTRIAAQKAAEQGLSTAGAVMASDAFFPFRDGLDTAAEYGIAAVIQPGGSVRDDEVVAAADEHGFAMVFTGRRHFRH